MSMTKTAWGVGPWLQEPDFLRWTDEVTGLRCYVRRSNVTGAFCGYVQLPDDHAWVGSSYKSLMATVDFSSVHRGVTWSSVFPDNEAKEEGWWVGFDCFHHGDVCPQFSVSPSTDDEDERKAVIEGRDTLEEYARMKAGESKITPAYREVDYVCSNVASLAQQVAKAA